MSAADPVAALLSVSAGVLVDAGAKATVVMVVAGAGVVALRHRSAATRHAVWGASFVALLWLLVAAWSRGPTLDLPWVPVLWALGCVGAAFPLLRGLLGLRRLRRGLQADGRGTWCSDRVRSPVTWGWWRPMIVLPAASTSWRDDQRRAALAHEQAHVARRDWAVHVAVWAVCCLFWFHPLVWWARRQLCREAEHAADDHALASGIAPSAYAELLVMLAHPPSAELALGGASSDVARRVRAVLDVRSRGARRWPVLLGAAMVAGATVPALAAQSLWVDPEPAPTCLPGVLP